jgi:hypothetical protein
MAPVASAAGGAKGAHVSVSRDGGDGTSMPSVGEGWAGDAVARERTAAEAGREGGPVSERRSCPCSPQQSRGQRRRGDDAHGGGQQGRRGGALSVPGDGVREVGDVEEALAAAESTSSTAKDANGVHGGRGDVDGVVRMLATAGSF